VSTPTPTARVPARRLPEVTLRLALAFAGEERLPLVALARLLRGMAIQVAYRWPLGQIELGNGAVLLWSSRPSGRSRWNNQLAAVTAAVAVGVVLFVVSNLIVLLPLRLGMSLCAVTRPTRALICLLVVLTRLTLMAVHAVHAALLDRHRFRHVTGGRPDQRQIDYLAAIPAGRGNGGRLLAEFTRRCDDDGVHAVLVSAPRHFAFYRAHGFRIVHHEIQSTSNALLQRPPHRKPPNGETSQRSRLATSRS
jgi:hypothetical protein